MTIEMYHLQRGNPVLPRIRIGCSTIRFNPIAKEKHLKGICYVELGYDRQTNEIIIMPMKTAGEFTLTVQQKKEACASIAVEGFLRYFGLFEWRGCLLIVSSQTKKEIRLKKGEKLELRKNPRQTKKLYSDFPGPVDIDETMDKPMPRKKRIDYQCANCGYSSPAWKYNQSMKPLGHPKVCRQCGSQEFVPTND